ncbi:Chromosome partition protein MukE [Labilithrix luteola]|uniref:Chromosome partition protein MukE n=1 Tax=Labilithrix luteola TaxID=1391654 RepID=A0A0K1QDP3_9BACT|nr:chromosome partition protein MukE [Labilithrix luteola]AKV03767.1 Chromosome partition protein MukE [Labilithrix luteola]
MSETRFATLEDVILDDAFPELDLALRRGRHIDRDDAIWYALLVDGQDHLEPLYRRYGCELVHKSDGYFYLLPINDRLGKRHLAAAEMLVGQALALLYLDPATVETGGIVTREHVLGHLAGVVGSDVLVQMMNPKRRRHDERIAAETVRSKVADALRRLSALGFVDAADDARYRLRASLLRFAEPLRGAGAPAAHLAELVAAGELVIEEAEMPEGSLDDANSDGEQDHVEAEDAELTSEEPVDDDAAGEEPIDDESGSDRPVDDEAGDEPIDDDAVNEEVVTPEPGTEEPVVDHDEETPP